MLQRNVKVEKIRKEPMVVEGIQHQRKEASQVDLSQKKKRDTTQNR